MLPQYISYRNKYIITIVGASLLFTFGIKGPFFYLNWLSGIFIIAIWGIYDYYKNEHKIQKEDLIPIGLLIFWLIFPIILTFNSHDKILHLKYIIISFFYIVVCYIFIKKIFIQKTNLLYFLISMNVIWLGANLVLLIFFLFGIIQYENGYFSGIFFNRNQFAVLTGSLSGMLFYFINDYQMKLKKWIMISVAFSVLMILVSSSLKGLFVIGLMLGLKFFLELTAKKKVLFISAITVVIIVLFFIDNPVMDRINRFMLAITEPHLLKTSESAFNRIWLMKESWGIIQENFLTGIGMNNSILYLYPPYLYFFNENPPIGTYSHNNYIEMFLNGGIFTVLFYYLPITYLFITSLKKIHEFSLMKLVFTLISIKLVIDLAQVSYFDFGVTFITVFAFVVYYNPTMIEKRSD
ncbi:O-antigen ligase family protein [Bacillus sp. REN3]|uniref:O-antigen ligase family protein n=1 Tax=Bacillus sp. REN3 TaxID=2802440 RepID=UPI001AEDE50C|nr:O-antigen ligase family protein [Bacillus sp. REN3]